MKTRILTAIGIAVIGLPLLFFSEYIIYPIAIGILALMSAYELFSAMGLRDKYFLTFPAYAIALALPILSYPTVLGGDQVGFLVIMALTLMVYLFYAIGVCVICHARLREQGQEASLGTADIAACFFILTYLSVSFTALSLIRYMDGGRDGMGVYYFALVFIGAWVCDTFAYFTGRLLGRHKLAPVLSPKKTVEGAIGGMAFTVAAFALYGLILESFYEIEADYLALCISGLLISVVSQMGDLIASLIKRERGVKDYGRILPGHGGIMDRFDSILSVAAVLMVICLIYPPISAI